ncbi:cubilin-like isoform X1 [Schistocerca gregaria]|uniref:cubilin-like isoform X1 n=1 Tax=Schistocerca gregaria TaxID=7010 RepID=UPI00211E660A|nr:cubilin-like isoform X1 [Schistocerca gregaria]
MRGLLVVSSLLLLCCVDRIPASTKKTEARRDHCNKTVDIYEDVSSPEVTSETAGRPMTCWYRFRSFRGTPRDWVLRIRFKKFKVGVLANSTHCLGGYVQIVDGNAKTDVSNRKDPGMFCGETEQPQTFISETSFVKVVFHVDNFTDQTYFSFDSRAEQQLEVYLRYGHHPELYPNRRGEVVSGSYCERVFRDCRLQTCYVQSPAYPGVYPRGLHCRYQLNTRQPFIKLYIENEEFNIDGQRCENIMMCPMRPISSGQENCPYDYIKIYDGKDESSPVIGVFCGMGKFPYSIIGTSEDLLVEFSSSAAGPLLNTGFHFNVGSWPGHVETAGVRNGTCDWLLSSEALASSGDSEGIFLSVAHWYPPHTSCTYLMRGRPGEVVRLYFPSFRINTIEAPIRVFDGDCGESLTLYDASWADDTRIIKTFCDTFSRAMEKHDFVSTGSSLFVRFESKTGSYSGSSLYYWAHYDFFNASLSGDPVAGTACDEVFPAWRRASGYLRSPLNTLVYKRHADPHHSVRCQYRFVTDRRLFARVILTIESMAFKDNTYVTSKCSDCLRDRADKLVVLEPEGGAAALNWSASACLCHGGAQLPPLSVVSRGERLTLELRVDAAHAASSYFKHAPPLFEARYRFVHAPLCGPPLLPPATDGELRFPDYDALLGNVEPPRTVHCIWELQVHRDRDLWLNVDRMKLENGACDENRLEAFVSGRAAPFLSICRENVAAASRELPILTAADLAASLPQRAPPDAVPSVRLVFRASVWPAMPTFKIAWTELYRLPRNPDGTLATSRLTEAAAGSEPCEFVCPGQSGLCIPMRLVCNGVVNCPSQAGNASGIGAGAAAGSAASPPEAGVAPAAADDESGEMCARQEAAPVNWLAVGLGAAGGGVMAAACLAVLCRACCRKRHADDDGDGDGDDAHVPY